MVIARGKYTIPSRTRPLKPSAAMILRLKAGESSSLPSLLIFLFMINFLSIPSLSKTKRGFFFVFKRNFDIEFFATEPMLYLCKIIIITGRGRMKIISKKMKQQKIIIILCVFLDLLIGYPSKCEASQSAIYESMIRERERIIKQEEDRFEEIDNRYSQDKIRKAEIIMQLNELKGDKTLALIEQRSLFDLKIADLTNELNEIQNEMSSIEQEKEDILSSDRENIRDLNNLKKEFKSEIERINIRSERIFEQLKEQGIIPETSYIKKIIDPRTSSAERIIFINNKNSCPLVGKIFARVEDYLQEKRNLSEAVIYADLINEFRISCELPLPIIIALKGELLYNPTGRIGTNVGKGFLLMEKAKGKEFSYYRHLIPSMEEDKIKQLYTKIGEQFGKLDALMYEHKGEILIHTNIKDDNFFYNEPDNQVYWVDLGGIPGRPYDKGIQLVQTVDGLSYWEKLFSLFPFYYKSSEELNSITIEEAVAFRKYLSAQNYFAQSYYKRNNNEVVKKKYNDRNARFIEKIISIVNRVLAESNLPPLAIEDYML